MKKPGWLDGQRVWWVMAVVLALSFAAGSVHGADRPTPAQRAASIEGNVRCPSCEGISVAQSSAPTAAAIRSLVKARIALGQSDGDIEAFLVGRYGQGILLSPPASGGTSVVWILPAAAIATALGALGVAFWRRRRVESSIVSDDDRALVDRALHRPEGLQ